MAIWTRLLTVFVVLAFSTVISVHGQNDYAPKKVKGCGLPIVLNTIWNPDATQMAGTWYKYRQSGVVTTNQITEMIVLNRTALPFSMTPATGVVIQFRQYDNDVTYNCTNRFFIALCGANGQCPGKGLVSTDNYAIPSTQDFSIMYLDATTVHFISMCLRPNYKSGMCDKPSFQVHTRVRPDKMTPEQAKALDDIIDDVLAPYCLSAADIEKQQYTDYKPFCPELTRAEYPECVKNMVIALENQISNSISN